MTSFAAPQSSPADVRRSASMGHLILSSVPAGAEALLGKALIEAGAIDVEGVYGCEIATHDWKDIQVSLLASSVTGTIETTLDRLYCNGQAVRDQDTGTLSSSVLDVLTRVDLLGTQSCRVTFTLGSGDAMTFAPGSDPVNPTALAEFNGQ